MDSISTGLLKIIVEDAGGSFARAPPGAPATSTKGGSYDPNASLRAAPTPPPQPATQSPQQRPAPPQAPAPSQRPLPDPSLEDKIKAILKDPGAKQTLGKNTSAEEVAKMGPAFIDLLYGEIARGKPTAPVPTGKANAAELEELKKQTAALQKVSESLAQQNRPSNAPYVPQGGGGPRVTSGGSAQGSTSSGAFAFKPPEPPKPTWFGGGPKEDVWAQVMKNAGLDRPFGLNLTPEQPKKKLPRAEPVNPEERAKEGFGLRVPGERLPEARVIARPVSDAEKSRDQWKPENLLDDFKNYLPAGLGKKMDVMRGAYKAASAEAGAQGAGAMGRAAAGIGEAAMAAGPVAALAAVAVAAHVAAKANQKAADAVEGMGRQAARFAANDHMGMFTAAVDGAKDTLREIPIVGELYASRIALAVAPINAFTTAVNGFVARGKELSGYNGSLAGANARADVRSLMGDLKEAKELGPALARLTDVESRANEEMRQLLLPIKEVIINRLAGLAETMLDAWEFVKPIFVTIGEAVIGGLEILGKIAEMLAAVVPGGKAMLEMIQKLIEATKNKRPDKKEEDPIVDWLNAADALGRDPWAVPFGFNGNADNRAQQKIAGPMFPGFGDVLGM